MSDTEKEVVSPVVAQAANEPAVKEARTFEDRPKRFKKINKKKVCLFCQEKDREIDYKDVATLRKFITEKGKIVPRRQSGVCSKHQRRLAEEIKKARTMALLPFVAD